MKTTLELPDQLFRKAKATAAERGQSLKEFVTEALRDKLALDHRRTSADQPAWMQGFGKLKRLHKETVRMQSVIDQEFEVIEPEDWR
ncbi:MAG TPA: hypothetical protein VKP67_08940 [Xanthobacteraceae bacterium]|nr:hypothetical protein [Xanthobacteraceae bacterium]